MNKSFKENSHYFCVLIIYVKLGNLFNENFTMQCNWDHLLVNKYFWNWGTLRIGWGNRAPIPVFPYPHSQILGTGIRIQKFLGFFGDGDKLNNWVFWFLSLKIPPKNQVNFGALALGIFEVFPCKSSSFGESLKIQGWIIKQIFVVILGQNC